MAIPYVTDGRDLFDLKKLIGDLSRKESYTVDSPRYKIEPSDEKDQLRHRHHVILLQGPIGSGKTFIGQYARNHNVLLIPLGNYQSRLAGSTPFDLIGVHCNPDQDLVVYLDGLDQIGKISLYEQAELGKWRNCLFFVTMRTGFLSPDEVREFIIPKDPINGQPRHDLFSSIHLAGQNYFDVPRLIEEACPNSEREKLFYFLQEVAFGMYTRNLSLVSVQAEEKFDPDAPPTLPCNQDSQWIQQLFARTSVNLDLARRLLISADHITYRFITDSVRNFFVAKEIMSSLDPVNWLPIRQKLFSRDHAIVKYCTEMISDRDRVLLQWMMQYSKTTSHQEYCIAAANAITILNCAGVSFENGQLNSCKIPGADLSGANLKNCDLRCATLENCRLDCCDLSGADLSGANLLGVELGQILAKKQTNITNTVAVSPDGKYVCYSKKPNIEVVEISSGQIIMSQKSDLRSLSDLVFSADGKFVYSAHVWENLINKWDISTGQCVETIRQISSNHLLIGKRLFSSYMLNISVVDFSKEHFRSELNGHAIIDVSARFTTELRGHTDWINCMVLSADEKWLYSGSYDHTIRMWDLSTYQCVHIMEGHTDRITSLVLSADGKRLYSGSADETIRVWDTATGQCVGSMWVHSGIVNSLVLSDDGKWLYSGSRNNTIHTWDLSTNTYVQVVSERDSVSIISVVNGQCIYATNDEKDLSSNRETIIKIRPIDFLHVDCLGPNLVLKAEKIVLRDSKIDQKTRDILANVS